MYVCFALWMGLGKFREYRNGLLHIGCDRNVYVVKVNQYLVIYETYYGHLLTSIPQ
jgi:hypothetical protein